LRELPAEGSGQVSRRTFVIGVTGLVTMGSAVAPALARAGTAAAAALTRAAGVAVVGLAPRALCLRGGRWVLAGEDGSVVDTQGLDGATVLDLAAGPAGVFAAGSQPAGAASEAAIWRSADGISWQEVMRLRGVNSEFTAVGTGPAPAMALGSVLTEERAPKATIAARLESGSWSPVPVRGLEPTAEQPITTLSGNESGWLASSVGSNGTVLFRSADGMAWGAHDGGIEDAAVQALLFETGGGVRWVGNALSGAATLAGRVGGERTSVPVPKEAHAVGAVWTTHGAVSYWLVDGRLLAAAI
jgi:hypothetical protein